MDSRNCRLECQKCFPEGNELFAPLILLIFTISKQLFLLAQAKNQKNDYYKEEK